MVSGSVSTSTAFGDLEVTWNSCLSDIGISDSALVAESTLDPYRRTYKKDGRVYKIVILGGQVTSHLRVQDLSGEYEILSVSAGIRGVPCPRSYSRSGDYEVLVLDEMPGASLSLMHTGWREFASLLSRLGALIARLSWRGVSHNDIRPENILLAPDRNVALVDFDQAGRTSRVVALAQSFFGVRIGREKVYGSMLTIIKEFFWSRLRQNKVLGIRGIPGWAKNKTEHSLPELPADASPVAKLLVTAWRLAQISDASSPNRKVAYYSFTFDHIYYPGERPWSERWNLLRRITSYSGKRILELGCNMALLSSYLLKEEGAAAALAVDADETILKSARLVAHALGVSPSLRLVNFDDDDQWETNLLAFDADIVFALNVLNWIQNKGRFLHFLGHCRELILEGHDSLDTETERLRAAGFKMIEVVTVTERGRHVLHCRRDEG